MPRTTLAPRIFTRRALIGAIPSRQHAHGAQHAHRQGSRQPSSFPLTLAVGLMTIGVILIVSLLQLLSSYFG